MSSNRIGLLNTIEILRNTSNESLWIPNYSFRAIVENSRHFYRVVAECDTEVFDNFNDIEIANTTIDQLPTGHLRGVEITCTTKEPTQFFMIATDFLNYIEANLPAPDLSKWCESWKRLVGNRYTNNLVYDVLAELLIFSYLKSCNYNPVWSGPDHERHDFRCDGMDCEVKSTVARTADAIITVQGHGQLEEGKKPIRLFVCQSESASNGEITVKSLLEDLRKKGEDRNELSTQFRKTGLNSSRDQNLRFNLLRPIKVYEVNSDFPKVDANSFKGNRFPDNVVNVSYTISLAGLKYKEIEVSIEDGVFRFNEVKHSGTQE